MQLPLQLTDLERFRDLDAADTEALWSALGTLVPYLDDHLVTVDQTDFSADRPYRLTVFTARDAGKTQLYLLVTHAGAVIVGRTDRLSRYHTRYLKFFDPLWHEVMSVVVTGRGRPLGNRLDLWIGVRRLIQESDTSPETVAYHGLVWLDDQGEPRIEPAQDDQELRDGEWQAGDADRFPEWFSHWNVSSTARSDLQAELPEAARGAIHNAQQRAGLDVAAIAWEPESVCYAIGDEIELVRLDGEAHAPISLVVGERATSLALTTAAQGALGGVVGFDARSLTAFAMDENQTLRELWSQSRHEFPTALAFMSNDRTEEEARSVWPDLLVTYADGRLERLRYAGSEAIRQTWQQCWDRLGLVGTEPRVRAACLGTERPEAQRRAALLGVVEQVLADAKDASPELLEHWLDEVGDLFRPEESAWVLRPAVSCLLKALEAFGRAQDGSHSRRLGQGDFLPALLYRIYGQKLQVLLREQIDRFVRAIPWSPIAKKDPNVKSLKKRSKRGRIEIWQQTPSTLRERIEHTAFALERWASAYLQSDTARFCEDVHQRGLSASAGFSTVDSHGKLAHWLAVAGQSEIRIFVLTEQGQLQLDEPFYGQVHEDIVCGLKLLPENSGHRLLALGRTGLLYLLAPDHGQIHEVTRLDLRVRGRAWAMANCPALGGGTLVAVVLGRDRRSSLAVCRVHGDELKLLVHEPLDLPWVRAVDLSALGESGYQLVIGANQAAPICFHHLDPEGEIRGRRWFRILSSGALTVRFSAAKYADCAVSGERNGLLWCADLRAPTGTSDLRWIYRLDGAIRAVERVTVDGEPHFLAGSENGKLTLLRASDGRRVWKARLQEPIRHVVDVGSEGSAVVVAMRGGWVDVYTRLGTEERAEALDRVKKHLAALQSDPAAENDEAWRLDDAESARVLSAILKGSEDFVSLLKRFRSRETRARIVRFLAEREGNLPSEARAILKQLTARELTLFLTYLPDDDTIWAELIAEELTRRQPQEIRGDESTRAAMAAMATYLQRIGRRNPGVGEILSAWPGNGFVAYPWVCLEFARLLVQATEQECTRRQKEEVAGELFPRLLRALFQLPPELIATAARVVPYDSPIAKDLQLLNELLEILPDRAGSATDHFEHLAQSFRPTAEDGDCPQLLAALIDLHRLVRTHRNEEWSNWRRTALHALRQVAERAYALTSPKSPGDKLVEELRACLDRRPFPDDHDPLGDRIQWIEQAWRLLDKPRPQKTEEANHPWDALRSRFIDMTRETVDTLWGNEHAYLMEQVRPRPSLLSAQLDEHNHLQLRIKVTAEGHRHLNDVSVVFDAGGEDGLRPPGKVTDRFDALVYPGRFPTNEMAFDGYFVPGQRKVSIRVSLQDGSGYRHEDCWRIAIPLPPSRSGGPLALPNALPRTYQRFCDALFEAQDPVVLAVLDLDLGRDTLVAEWQRRFPGRAVDLDAALRDFGPGRRYGARNLDLPLIQEAIEGAIVEVADREGNTDRSQGAAPPFLVGPTGELIQRLLDGDGEDVLDLWLYSLRARTLERAQPRLVVLVSSAHACRLRALDLGPIVEVAAHRLDSGDPRTSIAEETRDEMSVLIEKETALDPEEVRRRIAELGSDLRLVLYWLLWLKETAGSDAGSSRVFLEQEVSQELLRGELASLPAFDLICALVGSETETAVETAQVVTGHVAARDYYSTTVKSAAKRLIASGSVFDSAILDRIKSDRKRLSQLWIQGLGLGTSVAPRSNLLGVVHARSREAREKTFRHLERRGIGSWRNGVFRTVSPYRELIRGLYDRLSATASAQRDGEVYALLMGKGRSPAEAVAATDVVDMAAEHLEQLMPGATKDDLRKLRNLAQYWREPLEEKLESVMIALFRPETVARLHPDPERWDLPLTSLDMPEFGVGQMPGLKGSADPEIYVIWVDQPTPEVVKTAARAMEEAKSRRERMELEDRTRTPVRRTPRVFLLGPGAEELEPDPSRRVAILRLTDACHAAWDGHLIEGLRRRARAQLRLTAFSPFQTNGALLPGSPLFVGREEELEFIKARIRTVSILIVGGRQVGKTSLLNRIYHWAQSESDLQPIYVDLQGIETRQDFLRALAGEAEEPHLDRTVRAALRARQTDMRGYLRSVARAAGKGRLTIFLLNEVDGLVKRDRKLIELWRGLNDEGLARFLMVGYSVIGKLGTPSSPFFHFTEGNRFGGKAMAPTALSPTAAEQLLEQLTTSELQLRWRSEAERKEALEHLLERSYRIPWVLQRYGQLLVERLERERREEITWDDIELVLAEEGQVVWQYIDGIDYQSLGYQGAESARRPGYQLVLFTLARKHYFLGGRDAPIRDPRLRDRRALDLGFSVGEARTAVKETVAQLLVGDERATIEAWFEQLDLSQALRLLTLTLTLEPDPLRNHRYGFLLHILPRELFRLHGKTDPTLDTLIVDTTIELLELLES